MSDAATKGLMLLYIDDNADDCEIMRAAIKAAKTRIRLHCIQSYQDGLAYLKGTREFSDRIQFPFPAAVMLNHDLISNRGTDLIRAVRREPDLRHLPVIVCSDLDHPATEAACYREGANHFLVKTGSFSDTQALVAVLYRWLLNPGQSEPLAQLPQHRPNPERHPQP